MKLSPLVAGVPALGVTVTDSPRVINLTASAGRFHSQPIGEPADKVSISASIQLTAFNPSAQWPPAAYLGLRQGENGNNSLQILAIRNRPSDDHLVVGYRIIADGKEVKAASIQDISLKANLKIQVDFENGDASVKVNDSRAIKIQTQLKEVTPYVSVSSGTAVFKLNE